MTVFAYLDESTRRTGDILHAAEAPDGAMPLRLGDSIDGTAEPIVDINYLDKTYRRNFGLRRPFPEIWFDGRALKWTRVETA